MDKEKRRLIFQALNYLEIMETKENQPLANLIRGILYEILNNE